MRFLPHITIILIVGALFYFGTKSLQPVAPAAAENGAAVALEAQRAQGRLVYDANCEICHGPNLRTTGAYPDLRLFEGTEAMFRGLLVDGVYPMPSFEGRLSEQEQQDLWAYVSAGGIVETP